MNRTELIRKCFRETCLEGTDPLSADLFLRLSNAGVPEGEARAIVLTCLPSRTCRGCDEAVDADSFDFWTTYWRANMAACHKSCKVEGMRAEAYECQCVDADCNDCRHFERDPKTSRPGACDGRCAKFDRPTTAYPNLSTGWPCFEHRKALTIAQV